jgi:hypothetical protein
LKVLSIDLSFGLSVISGDAPNQNVAHFYPPEMKAVIGAAVLKSDAFLQYQR